MSEEQAANEHRERRPDEAEFVGMPCCPGGMTWSGPRDVGRMMQACPGTTWFRRHRLAVYTALTVAVLGFLALQVAWILGVIAFFRTL